MTLALNHHRFLELFADDMAARHIIWHHVQATFHRCLQELSESQQGKRPPDSWQRALHELKGATLNIGAEELSGLCQHHRNTPPNTPEAAMLLPQLTAAFQRLEGAMLPLLQPS